MINGTIELKANMDDDVVISGISGVFPESDNVVELANNLFAKRDLVTEDERRWKKGKCVILKNGSASHVSAWDLR